VSTSGDARDGGLFPSRVLEVSDLALTERLLKGPLLREGLLLKGPLLTDWDGERGSILISGSCLMDMMVVM